MKNLRKFEFQNWPDTSICNEYYAMEIFVIGTFKLQKKTIQEAYQAAVRRGTISLESIYTRV